jgi:hypothetical protein
MTIQSWSKHGNWSPGEVLRSGDNLITMGETGTRYGATLEIHGWDGLQANLRTLAAKYPEALGMALREEATAIIEQSMAECPYDPINLHEDGTPHLVDTAQVEGPYHDGDNTTVIMSYATPYAVIQHENLDFHHPTPGTKAKYLEGPMMERARFIGPNLIKAVDLERLNIGYQAADTRTLRETAVLEAKQARAFRLFNSWGEV